MPTPTSASPPQTQSQPQTHPPQPLHSPPLPPPLSLLPTLLSLLTDLSPSLSSTSAATTTTTNSQPNTTTASTTVKDLQNNLLPLRLQIKRMRAAIAELPDGERSIVEQREEMRVLEERVGALRGVLAGLGREEGRG